MQKFWLGGRGTRPAVRSLKLIDFRSENKIAFGQSIDLVRPDRDFSAAPTEADIWMMALFFREVANAVHKRLGLFKILKPVFFP
jgi:hypothetical protein